MAHAVSLVHYNTSILRQHKENIPQMIEGGDFDLCVEFLLFHSSEPRLELLDKDDRHPMETKCYLP